MLPSAELPQLFALAAALLFATGNHFQSIGLPTADRHSALLVNVATGALVYLALAPLYFSWSDLETRAALLFALVGVFRPPLSMTFSLMAIGAMGPTLASAFAATAPMFAAAFAIALLGETMTLPIAIGTSLIVGGAVIATLRPASVKRAWPIWAIGLPLMTAAIRAGAHAITKLGLEDVGNAMFASLLGYVVGVTVISIGFIIRGHRFTGSVRSLRWFVLAGLCSSAGIFCLNTALNLGTVLTVAPIAATAPIFALALSVAIFRKETITWRTVGAIGLVVPGVILLIVS
ncbi:MAG: EamA family transporter [Pseudomonadota bacterium]